MESVEKKSWEWHHVQNHNRMRVAGVDLTNVAAGQGQELNVTKSNRRFESTRVNLLIVPEVAIVFKTIGVFFLLDGIDQHMRTSGCKRHITIKQWIGSTNV